MFILLHNCECSAYPPKVDTSVWRKDKTKSLKKSIYLGVWKYVGLSCAIPHKGSLESSFGAKSSSIASNMFAFVMVYVLMTTTWVVACECRGNWIIQFLSNIFLVHNIIFSMVNFLLQTIALQISMYLYRKESRFFVCIMAIFNNQFLVMWEHGPRMPNLESMWFAFGNEWVTATIALPHAN